MTMMQRGRSTRFADVAVTVMAVIWADMAVQVRFINIAEMTMYNMLVFLDLRGCPVLPDLGITGRYECTEGGAYNALDSVCRYKCIIYTLAYRRIIGLKTSTLTNAV